MISLFKELGVPGSAPQGLELSCPRCFITEKDHKQHGSHLRAEKSSSQGAFAHVACDSQGPRQLSTPFPTTLELWLVS